MSYEIRQKVSTYIERLGHGKESRYIIEAFMPIGYQNPKEYILKSKMREKGSWASSLEIAVAAKLLGIDIFTYIHGKWQRFQAVDRLNRTEEAIYLTNETCFHYDVVTSVYKN